MQYDELARAYDHNRRHGDGEEGSWQAYLKSEMQRIEACLAKTGR